MGARHERGGGEDEEGCPGLFREAPEPVPDAAGQVPELRRRVELEIQDKGGEIPVPEKQVGGPEGFRGVPAPDPEKVVARRGAVGVRIETVPPVDEDEETPFPGRPGEEIAEEQGPAASGLFHDDLGDPGRHEINFHLRSGSGTGHGIRCCHGPQAIRIGVGVGGGETLPEQLAQGTGAIIGHLFK